MDSALVSYIFSLQCLLDNEPDLDSLPTFSYTVETTSLIPLQFNINGVMRQTPITLPLDGRLEVTGLSLLNLMEVLTSSDDINRFVDIICVVSNTFGNDSATTHLSICGT